MEIEDYENIEFPERPALIQMLLREQILHFPQEPNHRTPNERFSQPRSTL